MWDAHRHTIMLFSLLEEGHHAICIVMNKPGGHYNKWNNQNFGLQMFALSTHILPVSIGHPLTSYLCLTHPCFSGLGNLLQSVVVQGEVSRQHQHPLYAGWKWSIIAHSKPETGIILTGPLGSFVHIKVWGEPGYTSFLVHGIKAPITPYLLPLD